MKKLLSIVLAGSMMLSGASFAMADAAASDLEPMDISVAVWDIEKSFPEGQEPDVILQTIMDKFNVTFTPMNIGWGDYSEKYNVWAASGTMPDIAGGIDLVGGGTYFQWVEDGVVRPLAEDLSAYPNIAQYMDLPEVTAYQVDGKNYFFPRMTYSDPSYWAMDRGLIIRKDWLDNLGLDMPTNGDELLAVMQAFTENDPDGNGQNDTIGFAYNNVFPTSQQIASYGYTDGRWVKVGDEWKEPVYEENTIPLIDMLRTAYKNGWMDQDFATRANNDVRGLFTDGRIGIMANQVAPKHMDGVYDDWVVKQPDTDFFSSVAIVPLSGDDCYRFQEMSYWSETYVGGQVDDAKLERIMMIMDYLYSDEGMMFTTYGTEGVDYNLDENGNIVITRPLNENGTVTSLSEMYPGSAFLSCLAAWNGDLMQYNSPDIPEAIREMCTTEYERRIAEWKNPDLDWSVAALNLTEKTEMSAKATTQWSIIIADTSDTPTEELYQTALAEWNAQGYEACWQAVTAAAAAMGK